MSGFLILTDFSNSHNMTADNAKLYRYIRLVSRYKSDEYMASKLRISERRVQYYRLLNGVKRITRKFDFNFDRMVPALEDYVSSNKTVTEIANNHGIPVTTLCKYIGFMLFKRQDETTKVITLQSKINDDK